MSGPAGTFVSRRGWSSWIPPLPNTWSVERLSSLARHGYATFTDGDWIETPFITTEGIRLLQTGNIGLGQFREQGFRYVSPTTFRALNCTEVLPGDVLICRLADPVGRGCIAPNLGVRMITSVDVVILKLRDGLDSRFLVYWLSSAPYLQYLDSISRGGTRERVSRTQLGAVPTPIPSLNHQSAIADHLDAGTARIDALIAAKRRMIDLWEERRRSALEDTVNRLRAEVPLVRLGLLCKEIDRRLGPLPPPKLLSVSIHRGVVPYDEANPDRTPRADDLLMYKLCNEGDIVLNRMRAFQGGVGRAPENGIVSPDYAVLRPVEPALSDYLGHLFRSPWFVGAMAARLRGIGSLDQGNVRTPRVNWDDLKPILVPDPTPALIKPWVERLDAFLTTTHRVITALKKQVDLLGELRHALVSAAVTGQLAITEAA